MRDIYGKHLLLAKAMVLYDVYYGILIYIYTPICDYMYVESTEYYCNYCGDSEIGFWCDLFCLLWGLAG